MTESPLLHASDSVGSLSPNPASEPLSHTQRRAVLVVTVMVIFVALACGVAGYMVGLRQGRAQTSSSRTPTSSSPLTPLAVSPLPSAGGAQQACTQEAKICPDGSSVGRTGPNCAFAPCPGDTTPTATPSNVYGVPY
jgi:hypothetical protein